jgi:hypothetical protein
MIYSGASIFGLLFNNFFSYYALYLSKQIYINMKKLILSAVMLLGLALSTQAQDISKNALGLRLGDSDGFGGEISYQRGLSSDNRLELDLGWRNSNNVDAFKLTGLYQWVWNIDGGFNWYAGVGGGLGSWNQDYKGYSDSGTFVFAAGDIGIEYLFDIPLQLSLDFRPEFYFNSDKYRSDNLGSDIALGIRYRFN